MSKRQPREFRCVGMTYGIDGPPAHPGDQTPEADAVHQRVNAAWAAAIVAAREQEQRSAEDAS